MLTRIRNYADQINVSLKEIIPSSFLCCIPISAANLMKSHPVNIVLRYHPVCFVNAQQKSVSISVHYTFQNEEDVQEDHLCRFYNNCQTRYRTETGWAAIDLWQLVSIICSVPLC